MKEVQRILLRLLNTADIYSVTSPEAEPQAIAFAQQKLNSQHSEPNRRDGAATTPQSLLARPQHQMTHP